MRSDNLHELVITGYTHSGAGVGRLEGEAVFVEGALAGERVLVRLRIRRKGYCQGELIEILEHVRERVTPRCGIFDSCGGCRLQHAAYPEQLLLKRQIVVDALRRIGGLDRVEVHPTLGMDVPWAYRNKGHFRVSRIKNDACGEGRIVLGFCEEGSHALTKETCRHLFSPAVTLLLTELEKILSASSVQTTEDKPDGLHHLLIRESGANGEIILVFIGQAINGQDLQIISREICCKFPQVVGVCHNNNPHLTGPVLAGRTKVIWGKVQIEDKIGEYRFKISPESFYQVNAGQTWALYGQALAYAALTGKEMVIDAYCGIGTISLFLAGKAGKVIGIETVKEAVRDAKDNAVLNQVANVEFIQGAAEEVLPRLVKQGLRPDVVVVDPPRKGCEALLLEVILQAKPARVVYVSCNPATLARDLKHLAQGGYEVKEAQPVDMFPQTAHTECCCLLERR